ncbi:hypothetical protein DFH09DRAFT_1097081 [Mycena vulgaris]|nr:hypothetical protein DFH09DRAFT_1097081 [Mycena vulgaris]
MFLQAAELSLTEIKSYRNFSSYSLFTIDMQAFTEALGNPAHDPFFSVENVLSWMISLGYQFWNPEDASTKDLKAYRSLILSEKYQTHPFFMYMDSGSEPRTLPMESTPISSRAPSRASSSVSIPASRASSRSRVSAVASSRASSPASFHGSDMHAFPPFSRASSLVSFHESEMASRPPSAMSVDAFYDSDLEHNSAPVQPDADSDSPLPARIPPPADNIPSIVPSTQTSAKSFILKGQRIKIIRQLKDDLLYFTTVPPTFDVPRTPTAILLDLSGSSHLLKKADGNFMSSSLLALNGLRPTRTRCENSGITNWIKTRLKRRHLLELLPELEMRDSASSAYGKEYFIGCSKWKRSETGSHLYWPMPPNVDEDVLRFVMENEGRLPTGPAEMNTRCVLTVHPRVGLAHCPISSAAKSRRPGSNIVYARAG